MISTLTAVRRSQLLARWPETHSQISSGIQRATQSVFGVYLKRSCLRDTGASRALGVLSLASLRGRLIEYQLRLGVKAGMSPLSCGR